MVSITRIGHFLTFLVIELMIYTNFASYIHKKYIPAYRSILSIYCRYNFIKNLRRQ